ncbi:MAG: homocysteine S-methyltransferase family protein, partial [Proteobacteria bacterium]|nr:homocysteine S-methyltransferase family protein [Pseudomonadota bacterium]
MINLFEKLLDQKHTLLADGATGTNLFAMGLQSGDAPELWNLEQPHRVAALYRSFIDAGSDIVLTNTFGGTRYRLKLHKAQHRVAELNIAAVEILKKEIEASGREVVVAGSIGPSGEILAPLGDMQPDEAVEAFAEQALARVNAALMRKSTLESFVHAYVTTDSHDTLASREESKLEILHVAWEKQMVRLPGWIGALEPR